MKFAQILLGVTLTLAARTMGGVAMDLTVCEGFVEPLGLHDATPSFSWKLPEGVQKQTAYRIELRDEDVVWGSGWVDSEQSVFVPYGGTPLQSRQQLTWRVDFKDENGMPSGWSEAASFELGLLGSNDWKAHWISPKDSSFGGIPEFKLIRATYRSKAHPERKQDMTSFYEKKIKDNSLVIHVRNKKLDGDPAEGSVKEVELVYQVDGVEHTEVIAEGKKGSVPKLEADDEAVSWMRREFSVSGKVAKARLYVTARGLYQVSINGEKVGDDAFAPGWTSYANQIETRTYDVAELLQKGENALGTMLGTGWYAGRLGWKHDRGLYGRTPELLLQLEIIYEDGKTERIVSDKAWKATHDGPIIFSSIYDGETYDARKEMLNWDRVGFDDTSWGGVSAVAELGSAALTPKRFAPVRMTEEVPVSKIVHSSPGCVVFDLGQNIVGWPKLTIPVEKGKPVTIRFAEMLNPDGTMHTDNYRSAKSTNVYTPAKTGIVDWQPVFTFHGFQYVELSGLPEGVEPEKGWVKGLVLHSDIPRIGHFESSHEKLNQLQSNITWGQRGNFLDIPTDCPQRDERLGWTGDAQAFCPTAMFNFDCHAFWKSWLVSMRHDQMKDGRIPHVIPDVLNGGGSPGWMDAATFIPWEVYVRTGDAEVLTENYEMMERLVGWYRSQSVNGVIPKIGGFGDWLQPYAEDNRGDTPKPLLGSAFYARSVQILSDAAAVLGKTQDASTYGREAAEVKQAFGTHYFDADGKLQNALETQTGYILALEFGLVPQQLKEKAEAHLLKLIGDADGHLRTGFLGTPYIAQVLDRTGNVDVAFELLFKETYPSWFYSINQGATTMWERWNSYSKAEGFNGAGMNSLNHYAYGAIGQWMYERIAGLAPDPEQPGYKHFFVRPVIGGPLTSARATLETAYGTAASGWKKNAGKLEMEIVVPPNTSATIEFPNGRKPEQVGPGRHEYSVDGVR